MARWQDDPVLARYYRELDRKYQDRRRELDIALLRTRTAIKATEYRIAAAEEAERRAQSQKFAASLRDSIERDFRKCEHFTAAACEAWADRTHRIGRTAVDDAAEVRQLLVDFRNAADRYQHDLRGIAELLGLTLQPVDSPARSPLIDLLLQFGKPWPGTPPLLTVDVPELRHRITMCFQLRWQTKHDWLGELRPDPTFGLLWPDELPVNAVPDLRRKVTLEARNAGIEAGLISSSLELLGSYTD